MIVTLRHLRVDRQMAMTHLTSAHPAPTDDPSI